MADAMQHLSAITLDEHTVINRSPEIESERAAAIADLLGQNHFAPASGRTGPFHLHLAVEENRLVMEIRAEADSPDNGDETSETIQLPLAPFRRTVKDYFLVCESYYEAMRHSNLTRLESIDVGQALGQQHRALVVQR